MLSEFFSSSVDPSLLLQARYEPGMVLLSVLIACIASLLALSVVELAARANERALRQVALASGALALGTGVWAMHFIGMLAVRLCATVSYDLKLTLLSVLPSLFASWVALNFLLHQRPSAGRLIGAGVLVGAGIGAMHYSGMHAMQLAPLLRYDPWWFAISIVVAVALAVLALWVRYSALSRYLGRFGTLGCSALVMGAAISGMHYTAMRAALFVGVAESVEPMAPNGAVVLTAEITVGSLLLGFCVLGANGFARYRQAARVAERLTAEWSALVHHLSDAVLVVDLLGQIRSLNPAVGRLLGYSDGELLGTPLQRLLPQWPADLVQLAINGAGGAAEHDVAARSGESIPMLVSMTGYRVGEEAFVAVTLHDVREQRRLLAAEQARQVAEAASQAKNDFLASMSHELRTPLNAILGYAQLLGMETDLDQHVRDYAKEIRGAGEHLLSLINDVIDLSRIESGRIDLNIESINLRVLGSDCLSMTQPSADQHGLELSLQMDAGELTVRADYVRLRQVLLNLLSNAIKYNRPDGSVQLAISAQNQRVRLSVIDSGPGIADELQARLFRPFDRLGRETGKVEGTGIGLTIAQRIIHSMGGSMGFVSRVGVGSTFWIELPQELASTAAAVIAEANAEPRDSRLGVLYIDDSPANQRLLHEALRHSERWQLQIADSGEQGLQLALQQPPALVLLDINLPGMDGYATLRALREHAALSSVPVIAVSANIDSAANEARDFFACVSKPIVLDALLHTMERALQAPR